MRCCFILSGLTRSLRWTERNIHRNVFAPFEALGHEVVKLGHFNQPARIDNQRSGEVGVAFRPAPAAGLGLDLLCVERQQDEAIAAKLETFRHHDLQAERTLGSHRNLLHAYFSLDRAWTLARMAGYDRSDVFVFLRPDLDYIDPWPARELIERVLGGVDLVTPDWHTFDGINDRFAVASRRGVQAYISRWELVERLAGEATPRRSEKLLQRAVELADIRTATFGSRGLRVRVDGRTRSEGAQLTLATRIRHHARPGMGHLLRRAFGYVTGRTAA